MAAARMCKGINEFDSRDFLRNLGIMSLGKEDRLLSFLDKKTSIGKTFIQEMRRLYFLEGESLKEVSSLMGAIVRGLISQHFIRDDLSYRKIRLFVNAYCYAFDCSIEDFWEQKMKKDYECFPILIERKAEMTLKNAIRTHLTDEKFEAFVNHAKNNEMGVFDNGEEQKLVVSAVEDIKYFNASVNAAIFGRRAS